MPLSARLEEVAADVCQRWSSSGGGGAGLAAAVVSGSEVVWSAGFGSGVLPDGSTMGADTICYVGLVAKQFTAAAVILAALDGHLALSDRARRWVPELPAYCADVTVDDLLHHTSGLRDYFGYRSLQGALPDHDYDEQSLLTDLNRQQRLNFEVGERYGYSNTNYVLLTVIAERATGTDFREFARARIFEPLGMTDSSFHARTRPSGGRVASAYDRATDGTWTENDPLLGVVGDGGMRSTVTDLIRWVTAAMDGTLDAQLVPLLTERGRLRTGELLSYGRGIGHRTRGGRNCLQHGGGLGAWRAIVTWYPDDHVGVVVLANAGDVDPLRVALALADPLLPGVKPRHTAQPAPEGLMGMWIDDDQGIVLEITMSEPGSCVLALWGGTARIRGVGDTMAMADAFGFRLTLAGNDLTVDDNGDPWGTFRRAGGSTPARAATYAGRYECPEFAEPWNVTADNDRLRVEHLPDDVFAPVLPGVYTAGATALRFTITASGKPSRMTVDSARATGFSFSASQ